MICTIVHVINVTEFKFSFISWTILTHIFSYAFFMHMLVNCIHTHISCMFIKKLSQKLNIYFMLSPYRKRIFFGIIMHVLRCYLQFWKKRNCEFLP